jgi:hypothetical protein
MKSQELVIPEAKSAAADAVEGSAVVFPVISELAVISQ